MAEPLFWTASRPISAGLASASQPSVQAYKGQAYLVWSDSRLRNSEVFFRYSLDDGISWSSEERVSETDGDSTNPKISHDGKFLHLTWREKREGSSEILYKRWDGKAWSRELVLSSQPKTESEEVKNPTIAAIKSDSESSIYAAWDLEQSKTARTIVYITHSSDRGRSWSFPKPLVKGEWSTKEAALSAASRETYAVWKDEREGSGDIFFKRLMPPDIAETNASNLGVRLSNSRNCKRPTIAASDPFVYAAWEFSKPLTHRGLGSEIFTAQSSDNGRSFSVPSPLSKRQTEQAAPYIIAYGKEARIFWQDGGDQNWEIYTSIFPNTSETDVRSPLQTPAWSEPVRLTKTESPSISPKADSDSSQIHLIWEEQNRSLIALKSNLFYMRYDPTPPKRPGKPLHADLTAPKGYDDDELLDYAWGNSSPDAIKYEVFVSVNGEDFLSSSSTPKPQFQLKGESGKKYKIFVEAIDEAGNRSQASTTSDETEVDTQPPLAEINSPPDKSILITSSYLSITCSDPNLSTCSLEYGVGASPKTFKPLMAPIQNEVKNQRVAFWDTSGLNGIYIIRLTAVDKANNRTEVRNRVIIDRSNPIIRSVGLVRELISSDFEFSYISPAWSNDGSKVAYASNEGGSFDIWTISSDGKMPFRLTNDPKLKINPSWSPKSDRIVFQALNGDNWDLWVVDSNGKNLKPILSTLASEKEPSWSPSGEEIAFISDIDGDDEIWLLINVAEVILGKPPKLIQLTHNRWQDSRPVWSPDGTKVAFQSKRVGNWDIFQIEADGTMERELVKTNFDDISPRWSSDGKQLLFISNSQLWSLNLISHRTSKMAELPPETQSATWSPKSDQIVYEAAKSLKIADLSRSLQQPTAKIVSPKEGDLRSGKVEIFGVASTPDFKEYKIEYLPISKNMTAEVTPIKVETLSTSEVSQVGFLGVWNAESLSGSFRLRLTVSDLKNRSVYDEVEVTLINHQPQILILEPKDGMITDQEVIQIRGSLEADTILKVGGKEVNLGGKTEFSVPSSLKPGVNEILIEVEGRLGRKTSLLRKAILDLSPPEISVDFPTDFQMVIVPYILISGKVNEEAKLKISEVELSTDEKGNFSRRIGLSEGTNVILIEATDRLGHTSSIARRVIYQRDQRGRKDTQPPAIVDVFPPENSTVQTQRPQISARLVDDLGIDSDSINFFLDGKELPKTAFSFDPNSGKLTYEPNQPILDGLHTFSLEVQDKFQNRSEPLKSSFVVDSQPTLVYLSAELLEDSSSVRTILSSNKKIASIPFASLIPKESSVGYSIQYNLVKPDKDIPEHHSSTLTSTHLLRSFTLESVTVDNSGRQTHSFGAFAWSPIQKSAATKVQTPDGASVELKSDSIRSKVVILRSQMGLDLEGITSQQQDAKGRNLAISGLVYQVQTLNPEQEELEFTIALPIPKVGLESKNNLALFYWNDRTRRWGALEGQTKSGSGESIQAKAYKTGFYALLTDSDPPVIKVAFPKDGEEMTVKRFTVETKISDRGSGIKAIELRVDGKLVEFVYDLDSEKLSYLPSDLDLGVHLLQIKATDRAGNSAQVESKFFTRDIFDFADEVFNFPNPTSQVSNIIFKLTKSADVKLSIYNISGALVYSDRLENSVGYTGGPKGDKFVWKGENQSGQMVSSGIYIYILEADRDGKKIRRSGKIALVR